MLIIELETLKKYIDKNLAKKFGIKFISSLRALILFVKISNEELCLCVNYRKLNVVIIKKKFSYHELKFFWVECMMSKLTQKSISYERTMHFKFEKRINEKLSFVVSLNCLIIKWCLLNWLTFWLRFKRIFKWYWKNILIFLYSFISMISYFI